MAIYDALGGVISSLINANSQKKSNAAYLQGINDTNAANLAIQRETNKQNLDMFNAANAFSERMWNLENSYNSPAAQRARMIQAGINPSDISAGASSSVQSTAGVPSQAAKLTAPGQTPIPDYGSAFRALGGSVREYKENQLLDEQIKQSRLATSMKETDRAFYYGEKERRAKREAADILSQNYKNESDWMRLQDLGDEINHLKIMRDKSQRAADDEHDIAVRTGQNLDAQSAFIRDQVRHLNEQDRIAWYNAHAGMALNQSIIAQNRTNEKIAEIHRQILEATKKDTVNLSHIENEIRKLDKEERDVLFYRFMNDDSWSTIQDAPLRNMFMTVFGVDPATVFSGSGGAAIGSAFGARSVRNTYVGPIRWDN